MAARLAFDEMPSSEVNRRIARGVIDDPKYCMYSKYSSKIVRFAFNVSVLHSGDTHSGDVFV